MSDVLYCLSGAEYLIQVNIPNEGTFYLNTQVTQTGPHDDENIMFLGWATIGVGSVFHIANDDPGSILCSGESLTITSYPTIVPSERVLCCNEFITGLNILVFLEANIAGTFRLSPFLLDQGPPSGPVALSIGQPYYIILEPNDWNQGDQYITHQDGAFVPTTDSSNALQFQLYPTTPYFQYCSNQLAYVYGSTATLGYPTDGTQWACTSLPTGGSLCSGPADGSSYLVMVGQCAACQGQNSASLATKALDAKYGKNYWKRAKGQSPRLKNGFVEAQRRRPWIDAGIIAATTVGCALIVILFYLLALALPKREPNKRLQ